MCLCFCCCCNCCNSFSSRCIECSILILSTCTFIFSLLNIIFIKWSHLETASFILIMILVIFSLIIFLSSGIILLYRFRGVINKRRNSRGACLARIGLFITIISFFITIISESLVQSDLNDVDHPCKNIKNREQEVYFRNVRILSNNANIEFCKDKSSDYNANICENIEYNISYLSSAIIAFCTFFLICLWFNDLRRIKEKVDGMLSIYDGGGSFFYSNKYTKNHMNFKDKNENEIQNEMQIIENDSNTNSVNRIFNQNSIQPQVVLVKNDNRKNQIRLSQPININFSKKSKQNFIRSLRQEMKDAIESIDEEDSSECKEKDSINNSNNNNGKDSKKEEKEDNLKISIYNKNNDENNIYKKQNDKKNYHIHYDTKNKNNNNVNNNDDKENTNTNVEEIKENAIDMNDLYSNK